MVEAGLCEAREREKKENEQADLSYDVYSNLNNRFKHLRKHMLNLEPDTTEENHIEFNFCQFKTMKREGKKKMVKKFI